MGENVLALHTNSREEEEGERKLMILFGDKLIKYNRYSSVAETRVDTLACKKRKCPQFRRQINLFCPRDKKKNYLLPCHGCENTLQLYFTQKRNGGISKLRRNHISRKIQDPAPTLKKFDIKYIVIFPSLSLCLRSVRTHIHNL